MALSMARLFYQAARTTTATSEARAKFSYTPSLYNNGEATPQKASTPQKIFETLSPFLASPAWQQDFATCFASIIPNINALPVATRQALYDTGIFALNGQLTPEGRAFRQDYMRVDSFNLTVSMIEPPEAAQAPQLTK